MHCFVALCWFKGSSGGTLKRSCSKKRSWVGSEFTVIKQVPQVVSSDQFTVVICCLQGTKYYPSYIGHYFHKPWNFRIPGSAEPIRDDHFRMSGFGKSSIFPGSVAISDHPHSFQPWSWAISKGFHNPMFTGTKIKHRYFSHWNIRPGSMILQVALFLWWDGQIGISSNFLKGSKGGVFQTTVDGRNPKQPPGMYNTL